MSRFSRRAALLALFCAAPFASAQTPPQGPFKPPTLGEYATKGSWDILKVGRDRQGRLTFAIDVLAANGHTCSGLEGHIRPDGTAAFKEEDEPECKVAFDAQGEGVAVLEIGKPYACRYYCGARAYFMGTYLKPPAGCAPSVQNAARKRFKALYDRKQYAEAKAVLEPVLACEAWIRWPDAHWVRNDMALTQFRMGDAAGCLATLKPLIAREDQVFELPSGGPSDDDFNARIERAARTNFRLCAGKKG